MANKRLWITEEDLPEEYIANSLTDKIFTFQTNLVEGALFYLPEGPTLGGDSFIIYSDDIVTSVLLNDFPEKREEARKKIDDTRKDFLKLIDKLSSKSVSMNSLSEFLYSIDKKLHGLKTQTAITVLKVPEMELIYMNGGENFLFCYSADKKELYTNLMHSPKLGFISAHVPKDQFLKSFKFTKLPVTSEDKIVFCTDGVGDINKDRELGNRSYIIESVSSFIHLTVEDIIKNINKKANQHLNLYTLENDQKVPDDYTIIALKIR